MLRPFRAFSLLLCQTQGVALGFIVPAFQAEERTDDQAQKRTKYEQPRQDALVTRTSFIVGRILAAVAEAIAQEVFQVGDRVDLLHGGIDIVLDPAIANRAVVEKDIARLPVAVARLAD